MMDTAADIYKFANQKRWAQLSYNTVQYKTK